MRRTSSFRGRLRQQASLTQQSSLTRRRSGPASVPGTGDPNGTRVDGIIFGRSEAATEPGRQARRKNAASHRLAYGTTVRKLRFDADCKDFLHALIEHPRAPGRFPKLRIGVPRVWDGSPGNEKAPKGKPRLQGRGQEGRQSGCFSPCLVPTPSRFIYVPPPFGHPSKPMPNQPRLRRARPGASPESIIQWRITRLPPRGPTHCRPSPSRDCPGRCR